jgi:hypothetical protein
MPETGGKELASLTSWRQQRNDGWYNTVPETRGNSNTAKRNNFNDIRELASLTSWRLQRNDGWYNTAPKDDRKRALIRNEKAEEFGLCDAAKTDTINITGWVATSQTTFRKNDIPKATNDSVVQLTTFQPPFPSLCHWQNKYQRSCRRRQKGDHRRKADKKRRIVRFTKEKPTIHLLHYRFDKSFWYDILPGAAASEKDPTYYINKAAMMISAQIRTEEVTQSAEISVQTEVSEMSSRIRNRKTIGRKKMNIPINPRTDNTTKQTPKPSASSKKYENVSLTIIVQAGEKYTADSPPPSPAANASSIAGTRKTNRKRKREEVIVGETVESERSDSSVVSAEPMNEEITDGFPYNGNPLFKPKKIQKQEYWEHISLVAPKKHLPRNKREWTVTDTKRFHCSVCNREFPYTAHSSVQIKRHLEKDFHVARL